MGLQNRRLTRADCSTQQVAYGRAGCPPAAKAKPATACSPGTRASQQAGPLLIWHTRCGQRRVAAMLGDMDVDELQHALGAIVLESAYLERVLRAAFSALVGSKYAAVIDGR